MSSSAMLNAHKADLASSQLKLQDIERRLAWLGNTRFALVMVFLGSLFLTVVDKLASGYWLLALVLGFMVLSFASEYCTRRRRRIEVACRFLERVIARMEDRWAGAGLGGEEFLPSNHPCASDLDLFGTGSLFERICLCSTRAGRERLADWILRPAETDEILARQEAVRELSRRADWRRRNFHLGSNLPRGIDTTALGEWSGLAGDPSPGLRILAPMCVALTIIGLAGWILLWWPPVFVCFFLLNQAGLAVFALPRVQRALGGLERRSGELFQLSELLSSVESESFLSPLLQRWQAELHTTAGRSPSQSLRELGRLIDLLDQRRNFLFAIASPFVLWTTQVALAIDAWRRHAGPAVKRWTRILGEMEALVSIAGYAAENAEDTYPDVIEGALLFEAQGLAHPLLPRARSVANDLTLDSKHRLFLVSGSNMSGKSTLLRAVGINAVLAQMGAPVRANHLRLARVAIGATLHIQDSLQEGRSRFYAEITRLRQIIDLTKGPLPVLFLLDEILHGTNSHDRKIGAEAVVRGLLQGRTIGLVTTHDLALTQLADELAPLAANVHFEDEFRDGEMSFDYRLKPGPIRRGNALALMRAIGLDVAPPVKE